jgi:hypothetical protein
MKLLLTSLFLIVCIISSCESKESPYAKNVSPSGRYTLYIYEYKSYSLIKVRGIVKLIDNKNDNIIHQKKIDDIGYDFSVIHWSENNVHLNQFADWDLPDGGAGKGIQDIKYDERYLLSTRLDDLKHLK